MLELARGEEGGAMPVEQYRCPFCGGRFEGSAQDHDFHCDGAPLVVVSEVPLTVIMGVLKGGYYPTTVCRPAEMLARCVRQLYEKYPGRRFQIMPLAMAWSDAERDTFAEISRAQSIVTALLAIEEPAPKPVKV